MVKSRWSATPGVSQKPNPGLLPGPWHPGGGVESPGIGPCAGECDLAGPGKAVWEVRRADLPALVPGAGGPASAQVGDPQRIQENTAIFDFALTPEDMARIAALPPFGGSGHDPDQIAF